MQLSCRRDTALQGGSVLDKSGNGYSADIIGLSSTIVMQSTYKSMELCEIMQNKGY